MAETTEPTANRLRTLAARTATLLAAWVVVSGDTASLVVGAPIALVAGGISLALMPRPLAPVRFFGALRFLVFFISQSAVGGIDVARRALHPHLPLDPGCLKYPLRLQGEGQRVVFANTVSLLPGTLSARFHPNDVLEIHALDVAAATIADIRRVEDRVADLFGQHLAPLDAGRPA